MPEAPLRAPGKLAYLELQVKAALTRGRSGACCVCTRPCDSWFSAEPPSGYVPLHAGCSGQLVEYWMGQIYTPDGTLNDQPRVAATVAPKGVFARRASSSATRRSGHRMPAGFLPGPYWQPGDDEHSPWTVLLETAAGHTIVPFGANRAGAESLVAEFALRGTLGPFSSVPVVGGVVLGPQGEPVGEWGLVPRRGSPRWEPVRQADSWTSCGRCGRECWPGVWMNGSVCRVCVDENRDPARPELIDPPRPAAGPPVKVKKSGKLGSS